MALPKFFRHCQILSKVNKAILTRNFFVPQKLWSNLNTTYAWIYSPTILSRPVCCFYGKVDHLYQSYQLKKSHFTAFKIGCSFGTNPNSQGKTNYIFQMYLTMFTPKICIRFLLRHLKNEKSFKKPIFLEECQKSKERAILIILTFLQNS